MAQSFNWNRRDIGQAWETLAEVDQQGNKVTFRFAGGEADAKTFLAILQGSLRETEPWKRLTRTLSGPNQNPERTAKPAVEKAHPWRWKRQPEPNRQAVEMCRTARHLPERARMVF